jgi:hypothetical protein
MPMAVLPPPSNLPVDRAVMPGVGVTSGRSR